MIKRPFTVKEWCAFSRDKSLPYLNHFFSDELKTLEANDPAWIHICTPNQLKLQLDKLEGLDIQQLPLYGVPFAVKDNIDVDGWVTTAACPDFAYVATETAEVVKSLQAAGAVLLGKTNLDQFATGLVGTRSPFGAVPNTFSAKHVSGGSSSGSASVVARGLVAFALGTDTAGSGRIPAGFNNLVGVKPTPGSVPMKGVLPACKSIDVVSILALTVADGAHILKVIQTPSVTSNAPQAVSVKLMPPWLNRKGRQLKVGISKNPAMDVSLGYADAYAQSLKYAARLGWELIELDMSVLFDTAQLLYEGPWVAERYSVVEDLMRNNPAAMDQTVHQVISKAHNFTSVDTFKAQYKLNDLSMKANALWDEVDMLLVPTATTCPTIKEVEAEPILKNSQLGQFTNFVNLLGWSALALPTSFTANGLPFGVTFIAPAGADAALLEEGLAWQNQIRLKLGCDLREMTEQDLDMTNRVNAEQFVRLAVVGAHLEGLPLHHQLTERGCRFVEKTRTSEHYKFFALANSQPPKPGLVRSSGVPGSSSIEVEIYDMPSSTVGSFFQAIAYPLGLGSVELLDGSWVKGFVCDASVMAESQNITAYGGWRNFLKSL